MKDKDFSVKELIKLVRACRASGVSELNFGDIHLVLHEKTRTHSTSPVIQTKEADQAKVEEISETDRLKSEVEMREEQLAYMQIENPARYEQLLIERDLEDGRKPTTN